LNDHPVCTLCSKPVAPEGSLVVDTDTVHLRCALRVSGLEALELQERSRRAQLRAGELRDRARALIARNRRRLCAVCGRSLIMDGNVVFHGDRQMHTVCWRPDSTPPEPPAAPGGAALQLWVGRVVSIDRARRRLTVGTQDFELSPDAPQEDLQVGTSVRVLYDAADGHHRVVEVRTLSG
jgi:hypothetical protein